jgi:hypothetical protein
MRHYLTDPVTGRKIYAPTPEDHHTPICGFCGDNAVESEDDTCEECVEAQREDHHEQKRQDREARRLP